MVDGGEIDPELAQLSLVAIAADHYRMPLFAYIEHLASIREKYGESAARLDLEFTIEARELRAIRVIEAAEKARNQT